MHFIPTHPEMRTRARLPLRRSLFAFDLNKVQMQGCLLPDKIALNELHNNGFNA